jgi:hypothetical protein
VREFSAEDAERFVTRPSKTAICLEVEGVCMTAIDRANELFSQYATLAIVCATMAIVWGPLLLG